MLVTFRTEAYSNITMFGDVAIELLKLMGHSGTVPSAILPEDIPAALERLEAALAARAPADAAPPDPDAEDGAETRVSLRNRAYPLIKLLEAAHAAEAPVTWD